MSELNFSNVAVQQIQDLLKNPVFDEFRRRESASKLRNEITADWIGNFMNRMQVNNEPGQAMNPKTGQPHTVESMVEELKDRVRLEAITKNASEQSKFPMSASKIAEASVKKKLTDEEKEELCNKIKSFIEDMFTSHRGYVDEPAVIHECRNKFGNENIIELADYIKDAVIKAKGEHSNKDTVVSLPSPYLGQPETADPSADMFFPLFENMKNI